jgi:hypothetical protein
MTAWEQASMRAASKLDTINLLLHKSARIYICLRARMWRAGRGEGAGRGGGRGLVGEGGGGWWALERWCVWILVW